MQCFRVQVVWVHGENLAPTACISIHRKRASWCTTSDQPLKLTLCVDALLVSDSYRNYDLTLHCSSVALLSDNLHMKQQWWCDNMTYCVWLFSSVACLPFFPISSFKRLISRCITCHTCSSWIMFITNVLSVWTANPHARAPIIASINTIAREEVRAVCGIGIA